MVHLHLELYFLRDWLHTKTLFLLSGILQLKGISPSGFLSCRVHQCGEEQTPGQSMSPVWSTINIAIVGVTCHRILLRRHPRETIIILAITNTQNVAAG